MAPARPALSIPGLQVVVHDIPRVPVQWHIIKQHKLVTHGAFRYDLPGGTGKWLVIPSRLHPLQLFSVGQDEERTQDSRLAQPALCCEWVLAQSLWWAAMVRNNGARSLGSTCQAVGKGSEGLVPARVHEQQGCQVASRVQPHPEDAVVQGH